MKLKESVFNFKYKRNENENVIYNTFSKALLVLDDTEYSYLLNLDAADEDFTNELLENGVFLG